MLNKHAISCESKAPLHPRTLWRQINDFTYLRILMNIYSLIEHHFLIISVVSSVYFLVKRMTICAKAFIVEQYHRNEIKSHWTCWSSWILNATFACTLYYRKGTAFSFSHGTSMSWLVLQSKLPVVYEGTRSSYTKLILYQQRKHSFSYRIFED